MQPKAARSIPFLFADALRVKPKIRKIGHGPFFLKKSASGRQFHEKSDPKSRNQASRSEIHSKNDSAIQTMLNKIKCNDNHQISLEAQYVDFEKVV